MDAAIVFSDNASYNGSGVIGYFLSLATREDALRNFEDTTGITYSLFEAELAALFNKVYDIESKEGKRALSQIKIDGLAYASAFQRDAKIPEDVLLSQLAGNLAPEYTRNSKIKSHVRKNGHDDKVMYIHAGTQTIPLTRHVGDVAEEIQGNFILIKTDSEHVERIVITNPSVSNGQINLPFTTNIVSGAALAQERYDDIQKPPKENARWPTSIPDVLHCGVTLPAMSRLDKRALVTALETAYSVIVNGKAYCVYIEKGPLENENNLVIHMFPTPFDAMLYATVEMLKVYTSAVAQGMDNVSRGVAIKMHPALGATFPTNAKGIIAYLATHTGQNLQEDDLLIREIVKIVTLPPRDIETSIKSFMGVRYPYHLLTARQYSITYTFGYLAQLLYFLEKSSPHAPAQIRKPVLPAESTELIDARMFVGKLGKDTLKLYDIHKDEERGDFSNAQQPIVNWSDTMELDASEIKEIDDAFKLINDNLNANLVYDAELRMYQRSNVPEKEQLFAARSVFNEHISALMSNDQSAARVSEILLMLLRTQASDAFSALQQFDMEINQDERRTYVSSLYRALISSLRFIP
jgi:hypothetical protein